MKCKSIVLSSGHGLYVRGAHGIIDEVDEARRVVDALAEELRNRGVDVAVFHDNESHSQNENLNWIVNHHNACNRELDVSIHFNAFEQTDAPRGTEVLYVTQAALASELSAGISLAGCLIDRGGKKRSDLFFLNSTDEPAVLIETAFVDSQEDCFQYENNFVGIVDIIAEILSGVATDGEDVVPPDPPAVAVPRIDIEVSGEVLIYINGTQVGTKG